MTVQVGDVRRLLAHQDSDAAMVLIQGRVEVRSPAELESPDCRGALHIASRQELVDRAGTAELSERDLSEQAESLDMAVRNLGG
ncbi:MAG: hypothetical protein CK429_05640 [Mycobacterium sp.]|jgi:hypothetical protein|uniref:Pyridine nucleotide-disulfide oxidoreductase n=1 Tax=Mycobacterium gordonae TaxID=1778 RepID=A0A1A6BBJ8_MYCGO|nr:MULTISPECIES: hypothetical protein [Mycobacterium]MBI2698306.1 hypothetical protein [Mycobacterium sp.]MBX9978690.1 hypothetical protein [Mycobacterium gordonae]OBR99613.1 hypothetical protein A9W98_29120 [Mycobacterium gordonae]PJE12200.1 MAG: hypothetical protein CK428_13060 [Mycobacterium sp.]PJE17717.1 MAG: hypothetical protein CK429_05640 [Mycobacterium sp.]